LHFFRERETERERGRKREGETERERERNHSINPLLFPSFVLFGLFCQTLPIICRNHARYARRRMIEKRGYCFS
jgi:hypothetical protein